MRLIRHDVESESFKWYSAKVMSRKKPVIGNAYCGAVASNIDDGTDRTLCKDDREITEKIKWLLDDRNLAKRMGERGFNKVINEYTWDKVANNTAIKNI